jgi:hypothetical protein
LNLHLSTKSVQSNIFFLIQSELNIMRKSPNECFVHLFKNMLRSILVNIRLKNVLYFFKPKPKGVLLTITFEVKKKYFKFANNKTNLVYF